MIDAHIHIESSMLTPAEFGREAVRHGTVAVVTDPHEIANVLGLAGVRYMLNSARASPCKIFSGAPSCVPATPFETAGESLDLNDIAELFNEPEVVALSEMMNFPGVLNGDAQVMAMLTLASERGYPVDGHAPGLKGEDARRYAAAGISTDHECFSIAEAKDKIAAGMTVQIREGSAARNFDALHPLITENPDRVMLCSDDKHPDDLLAGHINKLAARAVALGHDRLDVLRCCCLNPIEHYRLPVGRLQTGDAMDAVLFADLVQFLPLETYVSGEKVAAAGHCLVDAERGEVVNAFHAQPIDIEALAVSAKGVKKIRVIAAFDGELLTEERHMSPHVVGQFIEPDPDRDVLMLMVLNRYQANVPPALGFIHGFGLKRGAIASTVAHDSHNLIAVGTSRAEIVRAVNALVESNGGIAYCDGQHVECMPLAVAGLMSLEPAKEVARRYVALDKAAKSMGTTLRAPYMTLSFMALLVIPALKLSDKGLFDGKQFSYTTLAVE
jgi:adenine deaminase